MGAVHFTPNNDGAPALNTDRKILLNLQSAGFRRVLIVLYAIGAVIALVDLLISSPNGSELIVVLIVVATGMWAWCA